MHKNRLSVFPPSKRPQNGHPPSVSSSTKAPYRPTPSVRTRYANLSAKPPRAAAKTGSSGAPNRHSIGRGKGFATHPPPSAGASREKSSIAAALNYHQKKAPRVGGRIGNIGNIRRGRSLPSSGVSGRVSRLSSSKPTTPRQSMMMMRSKPVVGVAAISRGRRSDTSFQSAIAPRGTGIGRGHHHKPTNKQAVRPTAPSHRPPGTRGNPRPSNGTPKVHVTSRDAVGERKAGPHHLRAAAPNSKKVVSPAPVDSTSTRLLRAAPPSSSTSSYGGGGGKRKSSAVDPADASSSSLGDTRDSELSQLMAEFEQRAMESKRATQEQREKRKSSTSNDSTPKKKLRHPLNGTTRDGHHEITPARQISSGKHTSANAKPNKQASTHQSNNVDDDGGGAAVLLEQTRKMQLELERLKKDIQSKEDMLRQSDAKISAGLKERQEMRQQLEQSRELAKSLQMNNRDLELQRDVLQSKAMHLEGALDKHQRTASPASIACSPSTTQKASSAAHWMAEHHRTIKKTRNLLVLRKLFYDNTGGLRYLLKGQNTHLEAALHAQRITPSMAPVPPTTAVGDVHTSFKKPRAPPKHASSAAYRPPGAGGGVPLVMGGAMPSYAEDTPPPPSSSYRAGDDRLAQELFDALSCVINEDSEPSVLLKPLRGFLMCRGDVSTTQCAVEVLRVLLATSEACRRVVLGHSDGDAGDAGGDGPHGSSAAQCGTSKRTAFAPSNTTRSTTSSFSSSVVHPHHGHTTHPGFPQHPRILWHSSGGGGSGEGHGSPPATLMDRKASPSPQRLSGPSSLTGAKDEPGQMLPLLMSLLTVHPEVESISCSVLHVLCMLARTCHVDGLKRFQPLFDDNALYGILTKEKAIMQKMVALELLYTLLRSSYIFEKLSHPTHPAGQRRERLLQRVIAFLTLEEDGSNDSKRCWKLAGKAVRLLSFIVSTYENGVLVLVGEEDMYTLMPALVLLLARTMECIDPLDALMPIIPHDGKEECVAPTGDVQLPSRRLESSIERVALMKETLRLMENLTIRIGEGIDRITMPVRHMFSSTLCRLLAWTASRASPSLSDVTRAAQYLLAKSNPDGAMDPL